VENFEERVSFRLFSEEKDRINKVLAKNNEKYYNFSHFLRCSVLKLLRKEEEIAKQSILKRGKKGKKASK